MHPAILDRLLEAYRYLIGGRGAPGRWRRRGLRGSARWVAGERPLGGAGASTGYGAVTARYIRAVTGSHARTTNAAGQIGLEGLSRLLWHRTIARHASRRRCARDAALSTSGLSASNLTAARLTTSVLAVRIAIRVIGGLTVILARVLAGIGIAIGADMEGCALSSVLGQRRGVTLCRWRVQGLLNRRITLLLSLHEVHATAR